VICHGFERNKRQRYYCKACKRTFNIRTATPFAGLKTSVSRVVQGIQALCENQGLRNASRLLLVKRRELVNWLQRAAVRCNEINDLALLKLKSFLEFDELYTYAHHKSVRHYVWTAIDAVSAFWLTAHVSLERSLEECTAFFKKFTGKALNVSGASSDGVPEYATLMNARYPSVPYAQIIKRYENKRLVEVTKKQVGPHTVAEVEWVICELGIGRELNTSAVERLNATLRSFLARLNRRTLKYSKHVGNLEALLCVFQTYYNFCLVGAFSKTTPACAAGIATQRYSLQERLTRRLV
jgi:transposase-like protein/IS1 family transposase